jgi:FolB domain-containing protein
MATQTMSKITIVDLEVFYCIGVTHEERAKPQRLLLTVDMNFDFSSAAVSDRIEQTINYHTIAQQLEGYGHNRSWKLVERLATNIADTILAQYGPQSVTVEVKKFPLPHARFVAVSLTKSRSTR